MSSRDTSPFPDPARLAREGLREIVHLGFRPTFAFADLEPGTYLLGVVMNVDEVVAWEIVEVPDGGTEKDLVVAPPDAESSVVFIVQGPQRSPLADVSFVLGYRGETFYPHGTARAVSSGSLARVEPHFAGAARMKVVRRKCS